MALKESKKKSIWLSYDLGLRGNYSGFFTFLDNHNAIECGNGLAYFIYDNPQQLPVENIIDELKSKIQEAIIPGPTDRIYIIYKNQFKITGKFIFGKRKGNPWAGYSDKLTKKGSEEGE